MNIYIGYLICVFHSVDHSRVVLSVPVENGSDYINASYIDVSIMTYTYIYMYIYMWYCSKCI